MAIKSRLIDYFGSGTALARAAGCSKQAVGKWPDDSVPPERVLPICRASNGHLTPYELRPDLYPDPEWNPYNEPPGSPPREVATATANETDRGLEGQAADKAEGEAA